MWLKEEIKTKKPLIFNLVAFNIRIWLQFASTQNFPTTVNYTFPAIFHNLPLTAHNHFSPPWSYF